MLELTVRLIASLAVVVGLLLLLREGQRATHARPGRLARAGRPPPAAEPVVRRRRRHRRYRVLVLGTTEHQVSVLTELDPDELASDLVLVPGEADEDGEPTSSP